MWQPPSGEQLAAWRGTKTLDDFPEPVQEVWLENYDMVAWFSTMFSQVSYSASGSAIGLNYLVAYHDFDDMELRGDERDEWKWKMKVMERELIGIINARTRN